MFDTTKLLQQLMRTGLKPRLDSQTRLHSQLALGHSDPLAMLAHIARSAFGQTSEASQATTSEEAATRSAMAQTMIRTMIMAAKADGEVDAEERTKIQQKLEAAGVDADACVFVEEELAKPLDLDALTSEVRDAQTAAQVYAASLFAIVVDTEAERNYLAELARRLGLDQNTVATMHRQLGPPSAA
jgi:uncharacterized membrane protein YebE (DUF533 family)